MAPDRECGRFAPGQYRAAAGRRRRMPSRNHYGKRRLSQTQAILVLLFVAAVLIGAYLIALRIEESQRNPDPIGDADARHAFDVTYVDNGRTYRQKSSVTSILLLGIDNRDAGRSGVGQRGGGQADFLRLIVIDRAEHKVSQLAIDRDTVAEMAVLGVRGDVAGYRKDNICLAHYYGDGKEKSCELTRDAVSKLLLGARIDFYLSMNMDGIAAFNDAIGGVTVTLEDDFSAADPAWTPGAQVTLSGAQAETFVRSRMSVGDGTNESRMRRQQQYISQAVHVLQERIQEDENFIGHLFDTLSPYLVSGISRAQLVNEAYNARDYSRPAVLTIAGEHRVDDDGFMQFWPDEAQLKETALKLLYSPVI